MSTTKEEIRGWLERASEQGSTHLFVVCDTYDWDDYPVFKTLGAEQARLEHANYSANHEMQKVMEVYRVDQDWDDQLRQHRAFNY